MARHALAPGLHRRRDILVTDETLGVRRASGLIVMDAEALNVVGGFHVAGVADGRE